MANEWGCLTTHVHIGIPSVLSVFMAEKKWDRDGGGRAGLFGSYGGVVNRDDLQLAIGVVLLDVLVDHDNDFRPAVSEWEGHIGHNPLKREEIMMREEG